LVINNLVRAYTYNLKQKDLGFAIICTTVFGNAFKWTTKFVVT
jgi:hypothetical protein